MLCRLCLKSSTEFDNIITSDLKCAELTLVESLYWIFGVDVDVNDDYSKLICVRCENVIEYIGSYRSLFQRNQLVLEEKLEYQSEGEEWLDQLEEVDIRKGFEPRLKRKANLQQVSELKKDKFLDASRNASDENNELHAEDVIEIIDNNIQRASQPISSNISPKAKKRRLKFIEHYYRTSTTALQELIKDKATETMESKSNKKAAMMKIKTEDDDRQLFQVNDEVKVMVCKFCSKIFKTRHNLKTHYEWKHKLEINGVKPRMKFKTRRRRLTMVKSHVRNKTVPDAIGRSAGGLRSSLNKILGPARIQKRARKSLFDPTKLPNLSIMKQLDMNYEKVIPSKEAEKMKSIILNDNCVSIRDLNNQYKWLKLRDCNVSLERCAVTETVENDERNEKENLPRKTLCQIVRLPIKDDRYSIVETSNTTVKAQKQAETEVVKKTQNLKMPQMKDVSITLTKMTQIKEEEEEDLGELPPLESDVEIDLGKMKHQVMEALCNMKEPKVTTQNTKKSEVGLQKRARKRMVLKRNNTRNDGIQRIKNTSNIEETVVKNELSNEEDPGSDFEDADVGNDASLNTSSDDESELQNVSHSEEPIVTVSVKADNLSEESIIDRYRWLNLKELNIFVEKCDVPNKYYQSNGTDGLILEAVEEEKESLKNNQPDTTEDDDSKTAGISNWKESVRANLLRLRKIQGRLNGEETESMSRAGCVKDNERKNKEMVITIDKTDKMDKTCEGKTEIVTVGRDIPSRNQGVPENAEDEDDDVEVNVETFSDDNHSETDEDTNDIIKDCYISLVRCPVPKTVLNEGTDKPKVDKDIESKTNCRDAHNNIVEKQKEIKKWKSGISDTLLRLQRVRRKATGEHTSKTVEVKAVESYDTSLVNNESNTTNETTNEEQKTLEDQKEINEGVEAKVAENDSTTVENNGSITIEEITDEEQEKLEDQRVVDETTNTNSESSGIDQSSNGNNEKAQIAKNDALSKAGNKSFEEEATEKTVNKDSLTLEDAICVDRMKEMQRRREHITATLRRIQRIKENKELQDALKHMADKTNEKEQEKEGEHLEKNPIAEKANTEDKKNKRRKKKNGGDDINLNRCDALRRMKGDKTPSQSKEVNREEKNLEKLPERIEARKDSEAENVEKISEKSISPKPNENNPESDVSNESSTSKTGKKNKKKKQKSDMPASAPDLNPSDLELSLVSDQEERVPAIKTVDDIEILGNNQADQEKVKKAQCSKNTKSCRSRKKSQSKANVEKEDRLARDVEKLSKLLGLLKIIETKGIGYVTSTELNKICLEAESVNNPNESLESRASSEETFSDGNCNVTSKKVDEDESKKEDKNSSGTSDSNENDIATKLKWRSNLSAAMLKIRQIKESLAMKNIVDEENEESVSKSHDQNGDIDKDMPELTPELTIPSNNFLVETQLNINQKTVHGNRKEYDENEKVADAAINGTEDTNLAESDKTDSCNNLMPDQEMPLLHKEVEPVNDAKNVDGLI